MAKKRAKRKAKTASSSRGRMTGMRSGMQSFVGGKKSKKRPATWLDYLLWAVVAGLVVYLAVSGLG